VVGFLRRALGDAPDATKQRLTLGEDAQRRRLFLRGQGCVDGEIINVSKTTIMVIIMIIMTIII
jgi:hypothetical protein